MTFAAFVKALIAILVIALCVYLLIWVLGVIGIALPPMVVKIIWAIAVLVALLVVYRVLKPVYDKYMAD